MIGLRGGDRASQTSTRVEICIAVANWVKGPTTGVPSAPALDAPGAPGAIDART
ncbi:hypothetical protein [Streptomyces pactum]|uniref:hypothetical protein n=1 Tax=Streptomyces pactum TaxID=68249 RepID=UPI0027DCA1C7|nr:hypothetical protein [Streptomyces pactum]